MIFESEYFKDSKISNYRDYDIEKKYFEMASELIELFDIKKKEFILDFGCATGVLLHEFFKRGYANIAGTDVSYWAISEGKKKKEISAHLYYYNLDLLNSFFDYIFFFDVLEHIHDEELEKILALLTSRNLLVKIPVSKREGAPYVLEVSGKDASHIQCHSKEWWIKLFEKFGYQMEKPISGKTIYDAEGLFAAHFIRKITVSDEKKRYFSQERKTFFNAFVYIDKDNHGIKDFLERVGNHVETVWALFDGVVPLEDLDKIACAKIRTIRKSKLSGRGKIFKEAINELSKENNADAIIFLDYNEDEVIEYMPLLLHPIAFGHIEVVMGSRFHGHMPSMTFMRKAINNLVTSYIRWRFKFACTDSLSRYVAISTKAIPKIRFDDSNFGWTLSIIKETARKKLKYTEVGINSHHSHLSLREKIHAVRDILKVIFFG